MLRSEVLTMLRTIISHIRGQRGQVLVMGVGLLIMSLGAIMISVDVGWWLRDKRDAQNDADAVALAAVQEIGNPALRPLAVAAGLDWADFNGLDPSELGTPDCADGVLESNFCFIDQNSDGTDDMVRVKVSRPSNSFIAEAFGVVAVSRPVMPRCTLLRPLSRLNICCEPLVLTLPSKLRSTPCAHQEEPVIRCVLHVMPES